MEREVRYCTTDDGVRIAYCVEGEGPPVVFIVPWPASIEHELQLPEARRFYEALGRAATVVRFDLRGTGASERVPIQHSQERIAADAFALIDHLGLAIVDLFAAPALWTHAAVHLAVEHPERVRRMVLWEPVPVWNADGGITRAAEITLIRANWAGATRVMSDIMAPHASLDQRKIITRIYRETVSPDVLVAYLEARSDVRHLLERVQAPVLALHPRQDRQYRLEDARVVASLLPDARIAVIEGDTSYFYFLHDQVLPKVLDFLNLTQTRGREEPFAPGGVRTVLFTDLVGHTEMMQRLGDARGRDVLREHERITRETLKQHGGAEVKTMGDGFMASFGSVTKAMDCAITLQRAFAARNDVGAVGAQPAAPAAEPLHVRVGLNAGEPIEEDGDLFGSTVILASRIAAQAGAGEILIPEPLRHLLSGKTYVYADRGETLLKGFEDTVRLYEVRWRE